MLAYRRTVHVSARTEPPPADSPEVLARITATLELVEIVARSLKRAAGRADLDELRSAGREGLLAAARAYDPAHGVPFRSFASYRIRGAMLDHMRRISNLSRPAYARLRAFERAQTLAEAQAEEAPGGSSEASPATPERADALLAERLEASAFAMALGFLTARGGDALDEVEDSEPDRGAERAVLLRQIEALVATRPEVEREALRLHYFEDLSLDEVGARLGLHKSWVCRVLARTIEGLAKQVREGP
jgi:RNA polymerase sigma factor FliA